MKQQVNNHDFRKGWERRELIERIDELEKEHERLANDFNERCDKVKELRKERDELKEQLSLKQPYTAFDVKIGQKQAEIKFLEIRNNQLEQKVKVLERALDLAEQKENWNVNTKYKLREQAEEELKEK